MSVISRRRLLQAGAITLAGGSAGCASTGGNQAEATEKTPTPAPKPVQVAYDIQLEQRHILITLRILERGDYDQLTIELSPDHQVTTLEGFEKRNAQLYQATQLEDSPSIQYQIFSGRNERGTVWIGDDWAVTFPVVIRAMSLSAPADVQFTVQDSGKVTGGNPIVILGNYALNTVSAQTGESFKIFAVGRPKSYTKPMMPVLRRSSELLWWNNYVTSAIRYVIIPSEERRGGSPYGGGNITVWGTADYSSSDWRFLQVLIHEYLHLREPPGSGDMDWINEAVPDYYAGLLLHEQGEISGQTFRGYITPRITENIALSEAGGEYYQYRYTKGRRVLAALDAEIRRQTDGSNTLQQVFNRVIVSGRSDLRSFKQIVDELSGHSFDSWIDKFVTTTATPGVPEVNMSMLPSGSQSDLATERFVQ